MWMPQSALFALLFGLTMSVCVVTSAAPSRLDLSYPEPGRSTAAIRYGSMSLTACLSELQQRGVVFSVLESARGVLAPVRIRGDLGGVVYRTDYPTAQRSQVPYEVMDCRLALALFDLARLLRAHDVAEVRIFSAWRPPREGYQGPPLTRHPGGMAADLRTFLKRSGEELNVQRDFNGRIGASPCGKDAAPPKPRTMRARELRSIVCEAADARIFNSILTPNHDRAHFNHFHVEVRSDVRWFLLR